MLTLADRDILIKLLQAVDEYSLVDVQVGEGEFALELTMKVSSLLDVINQNSVDIRYTILRFA